MNPFEEDGEDPIRHLDEGISDELSVSDIDPEQLVDTPETFGGEFQVEEAAVGEDAEAPPPSEPENPVEARRGSLPRTRRQSVTLEADVVRRLTQSLNVAAMTLLNLTTGEMDDAGENFSPDFTGQTDIIRKIFEDKELTDDEMESFSYKVMKATSQMIEQDATREMALSRPDSDWRQTITEGNGRIGMAFRTAPTSGKELLSGEEALYHVRSALGLGRPFFVPLPHTGITVELMPPKLTSLAVLFQKVLDAKEQLGRRQKSIMISNASVFIRQELIEFILKHVSKSNYEHKDIDSMLQVISVLDYPALVAGMAATLWPGAYELHIPCIETDPKTGQQCGHINKFELFLNHMTVFDNARLTKQQRLTLMRWKKTVTDEDIVAYKAAMLNGEPERRVLLREDGGRSVYLTFAQPTLQEHLVQGQAWIDGLSEHIQREISSASARSKDEIMDALSTVSVSREWSHWVKNVTIAYANGEESVITARDDIDESLESLMEDQDLVDIYITKLRDFVADSTLAVTGVPRTQCEKCKGVLGGAESKDPLSFEGGYDSHYMIPVDVQSVFFILTRSKV